MKPIQDLYKELLAPIKDKLDAVEDEISRELTSDISVISNMYEYLARTKGKRIRPALFLLCADLLKVESDQKIPLATVLEFLHTATLIHDDIIDTSDKRRGKATLNSIWGNELTVLLGDYLYLRAVAVALEAKRFNILEILTEITLKLIEGEMIQLDKRGDMTISEEKYLEIVQCKTAFLFSGCGRIPAALAAASESATQAVSAYCFNMGISFQMADDILDFTSEEKILGKPVASDLSEGTVTLPVLYALQSANQNESKIIQEIMGKNNVTKEKRSRLLEILNKYGCIDRARSLAEDFSNKAVNSLDEFPDSHTKSILTQLPVIVIERSY